MIPMIVIPSNRDDTGQYTERAPIFAQTITTTATRTSLKMAAVRVTCPDDRSDALSFEALGFVDPMLEGIFYRS